MIFNNCTKVFILTNNHYEKREHGVSAKHAKEGRGPRTSQRLTVRFRNHSPVPVVQDLSLQPKAWRKGANNSQTDGNSSHKMTGVRWDRSRNKTGDLGLQRQHLPRPRSRRGSVLLNVCQPVHCKEETQVN